LPRPTNTLRCRTLICLLTLRDSRKISLRRSCTRRLLDWTTLTSLSLILVLLTLPVNNRFGFALVYISFPHSVHFAPVLYSECILQGPTSSISELHSRGKLRLRQPTTFPSRRTLCPTHIPFLPSLAALRRYGHLKTHRFLRAPATL